MSSKKAAMGKSPHAGQKRPAAAAAAAATPRPATASKKQQPSAKKQKKAATPARLSFGAPGAGGVSDDDSDDDAAIMRLKAGLSATPARASAAADEAADDGEDDDGGFEVAAASGDDDEDAAQEERALPSDLDDDDDETMADAADDESEEEPAPAPRKPLPAATPVKPAATPAKPVAAAASAVKPAAAAAKPTPAKAAAAAAAPVPTPAKSSPALKPTPAKPAPAKPAAAAAVATPKQPAPKAAAPAVKFESETSDDEEEAPAKPSAKPTAAAAAAAKPAAAKPTPAPAAAKKPVFSVVGDASSESSDSEEDTPAAAPAYKKPQPVRKPTPLQGDASVNPPPKAPKPVKAAAAAAAAAAGPTSSFVHPLTRPATAAHTGRAFTVSIALPGSIISNAQSKELRTYVAGQIARAAATFNVDEIVVFAEGGKQSSTTSTSGHFEGATRSTDPDIFLARILQYLETPQYLRKLLFPKHADLAAAGLLNPLDSPHHVRIDEEVPYREGVVVNRPVAAKQAGEAGGCWANIGLKTEAFIPRNIDVGTRVTVHIPQVAGSTVRKSVAGRAVAHSTPREKNGTYWGYQTRLASSLSHVWSECPFKGGYDMSIGTSERGEDVHSPDFSLPPFQHLIIFFGGLAGLEEHIDGDESINVKRPEQLFQMYVNCVVGQGCRTIRTEEAIPITLAAMYRHVRLNQPPNAAEASAE